MRNIRPIAEHKVYFTPLFHLNMQITVNILIGLIAFLHLYILWFEMFAWETKWKKIFKSFPDSLFTPTKTMAANQWLYNWFLAAGLMWTFFITDIVWSENIALFFLGCVWMAGVYWALTIEKKTLFIQTIPATITIALILFR